LNVGSREPRVPLLPADRQTFSFPAL
jgi:hypothetical protein